VYNPEGIRVGDAASARAGRPRSGISANYKNLDDSGRKLGAAQYFKVALASAAQVSPAHGGAAEDWILMGTNRPHRP